MGGVAEGRRSAEGRTRDAGAPHGDSFGRRRPLSLRALRQGPGDRGIRGAEGFRHSLRLMWSLQRSAALIGSCGRRVLTRAAGLSLVVNGAAEGIRTPDPRIANPGFVP